MGKTAIVTGASRGIGRSIAKRLATDGFSVVVNYVGSSKEAEEVVNEIKSTSGSAVAISCDISQAKDVVQLFEQGSAGIWSNSSGRKQCGYYAAVADRKQRCGDLRQGDCH
jgi:NAD(P)-dependent dehydrogenase (short-subunit alcohol dehydrogenase family)